MGSVGSEWIGGGWAKLGRSGQMVSGGMRLGGVVPMVWLGLVGCGYVTTERFKSNQ